MSEKKNIKIVINPALDEYINKLILPKNIKAIGEELSKAKWPEELIKKGKNNIAA